MIDGVEGDADDGLQCVECSACGGICEVWENSCNRCPGCYALLNDEGEVLDDLCEEG